MDVANSCWTRLDSTVVLFPYTKEYAKRALQHPTCRTMPENVTVRNTVLDELEFTTPEVMTKATHKSCLNHQYELGQLVVSRQNAVAGAMP